MQHAFPPVRVTDSTVCRIHPISFSEIGQPNSFHMMFGAYARIRTGRSRDAAVDLRARTGFGSQQNFADFR
jgi:hypothetical protein